MKFSLTDYVSIQQVVLFITTAIVLAVGIPFFLLPLLAETAENADGLQLLRQQNDASSSAVLAYANAEKRREDIEAWRTALLESVANRENPFELSTNLDGIAAEYDVIAQVSILPALQSLSNVEVIPVDITLTGSLDESLAYIQAIHTNTKHYAIQSVSMSPAEENMVTTILSILSYQTRKTL